MHTQTPPRTALRRIALVFGFLAAACFASPAAHALKLPLPSPRAKVMQTVGITKISIAYHSPAVKGRKIWGGLVPYGKIWRTGANVGTEIKFRHDTTFGKTLVKAGTYYIFTIPTEKTWTFFLSTDERAWTRGPKYDTKHTVAQVEATPTAIPHRERLAFQFTDTTDNSTLLHVEWEKVRLSVQISTDTPKLVEAAIHKGTKNAWRPFFLAGRYYLGAGDANKALAMLNTSTQLKETWWNTWFKALAFEKLGRAADAIQSGQRAAALGKGDRIFDNFFRKGAEAKIAAWQKAAAPPKK